MQDPRARRQTCIDGQAKMNLLVVIAADVADGRNASSQEVTGRPRQGEVPQLARLRELSPARRRQAEPFGMGREMDVRVDQTG